jgi:hypothetical protein
VARTLRIGRTWLVVFVASVGSLGWTAQGAMGSPPPTWMMEKVPTPPGHEITVLLSVSCPSSSLCVAVGSAGGPLAAIWSDGEWRLDRPPIPSGYQQGELAGVACLSVVKCMAVGDVGTPGGNEVPLVDEWDGQAWQVVGIRHWNTSALQAVSCVTATFCMAVGWVANGVDGQDPLVERWDGIRWKGADLPVAGRSPVAQFASVSCATASSCMAVGSIKKADHSEHAIAGMWNGTQWTLGTPVRVGASEALTGVSCTAATFCIAVGHHADPHAGELPLAERWNGARWRILPVPHPMSPTVQSQGGQFRGVSCATEFSCTSVGTAASGMFAESWDAHGWKLETIEIPADLNTDGLLGISCASATMCKAVGWWTSNSDFKIHNLVEAKGSSGSA